MRFGDKLFAGLTYLFIRRLQIITLIPIWVMLGYIAVAWTKPPPSMLALPIIALLATVWAVPTRICTSKPSSFILGCCFIIDLAFFGLLIAGVALLTSLARASVCDHMGNDYQVYELCMMYEAAWALGILNIILFFWSAIVSFIIILDPGPPAGSLFG